MCAEQHPRQSDAHEKEKQRRPHPWRSERRPQTAHKDGHKGGVATREARVAVHGQRGQAELGSIEFPRARELKPDLQRPHGRRSYCCGEQEAEERLCPCIAQSTAHDSPFGVACDVGGGCTDDERVVRRRREGPDRRDKTDGRFERLRPDVLPEHEEPRVQPAPVVPGTPERHRRVDRAAVASGRPRALR